MEGKSEKWRDGIGEMGVPRMEEREMKGWNDEMRDGSIEG